MSQAGHLLRLSCSASLCRLLAGANDLAGRQQARGRQASRQIGWRRRQSRVGVA